MKKILLVLYSILLTSCVAGEIDMFENRKDEISKEK